MNERKFERVNIADEGKLNENDTATTGWLEDAPTYTAGLYTSRVDMFAQDVLVLGFNVTLEGTWQVSTSLGRLGAMSRLST